MCVKAVHTCPFVFDSVFDQYKTQVWQSCLQLFFMLKYCLDKYKTPEIRDKTLEDFYQH